MLTEDQIGYVPGMTVLDQNGEKVGKAGQVYLDDETGRPEWVSVNTGLFGMSESLVPLDSASVDDDVVRVGYAKDHIKDAPHVDAEQHLDVQDERRLYEHYGRDYGTSYGTGYDEVAAGGLTGEASGQARTSGDDAMTVSEERLNVGTERREAGRARLRKYVVTEDVQTTVPVTREEVRLEREPITDGNVGEAMEGPDITEGEHTVTLHEERPVVNKETVPVERVRLATETVRDEVPVNEQVRKERVETDGDV